MAPVNFERAQQWGDTAIYYYRKLDFPIAIHFDKTENILYVCDVNRIRKIAISSYQLSFPDLF
jgi:hypothetical protein